MSGWKQPFLLSRNITELNACVMILETNRVEGEEFLYYSYKTNDQCNNLLNLKGIILASMGISHSIFCEDYRVMVLEEISNKTNNESVKYKVTSRSYLKNYMISVIMPFMTPDNILVYVCKELAEFITIFFERFEETSKFTDILNKYCEVLLFNTINYAISKEKEDSGSTPLSLMPVMNITFSYNEIWPCFLVKPPINDNLRTELIEIMNTLNSDRSVLQETLTLNDPPFYIRGFALLFGGFVMFNSLSNKELSSLSRLAMLHEMFIRSQSSSELLSCEFLFETEDFDDLSRIQRKNDDKKKIIVTILAQREFVLLISLDILGKNNCSFDPFYHKRAEDLVTSLLKKVLPIKNLLIAIPPQPHSQYFCRLLSIFVVSVVPIFILHLFLIAFFIFVFHGHHFVPIKQIVYCVSTIPNLMLLPESSNHWGKNKPINIFKLYTLNDVTTF